MGEKWTDILMGEVLGALSKLPVEEGRREENRGWGGAL